MKPSIDTPNAIGILCREKNGDICFKGYTFMDFAELLTVTQIEKITREDVARALLELALGIRKGETVALANIQPKGRDQFMTSGKLWDFPDLDTNLKGGR